MYLTTKALVLRETAYKDADKILTVLTEAEGKLSVKARGAVRKGSRYGAAAQALCYSEMTLFRSRDKWSVNEAETIEQFLPLREDLAALALGYYFAELLETVAVENSPDPALLQLGLNALYALSRRLYPPERVKAVFELRLLCIAGFAPDLDGEGEYFSLAGGRLHRVGEAPGAPGRSLRVDEQTRDALRYVSLAEPKKIFSFALPAQSERLFAAVCEEYAKAQLERRFSTLEYWKTIRL